MKDYYNAKKFSISDKKFKELKSNKVKITITCLCEKSKIRDIDKKNLIVGCPVEYDCGIFRVDRVWEEKEVTKKTKKIAYIQLSGIFSPKDPNGHIANGWNESELERKCVKADKEVGTINSLEV